MMSLHRSFWSFAVSVYSVPGMQALCLQWQDEKGMEVTLLLWALWLDAQQQPWNEVLWLQGVCQTQALRRQVRRWRYWRRCCPRSLARWRRWWLSQELMRERRVIERLEQVCGNCAEIADAESIMDMDWRGGYTDHLLQTHQLELAVTPLPALWQQWLRDVVGESA